MSFLEQIDALVAEKVMGLNPIECVYIGGDCYRDASLYKPGVMGERFWRLGEGECTEPVPQYSTDIYAARFLVKELRKRFDVVVGWDKSGESFCRLYVDREKDYHPHYERFAKTPELAICWAALRSVGVEAPAEGEA